MRPGQIIEYRNKEELREILQEAAEIPRAQWENMAVPGTLKSFTDRHGKYPPPSEDELVAAARDVTPGGPHG